MGEIGNLIKELRTKKGLTQAQLAEKIGVSDKTVGKWEQGQGNPDLSMIKPIAIFFGITTDELISGVLDDISSDMNKSIYEKIILSGLDKLPMFLNKGIDLFGEDEYNKSIIDYIYEYKDYDFLNYAIQNHWFSEMNVGFTIVTKTGFSNRSYDNHEINFFFQKRLFPKVMNPTNNFKIIDGKISTRIQNPIEKNYKVSSSFYDIFTFDTKNILHILIENENNDILKSYSHYSYFKNPEVESYILEGYSRRNTFDSNYLLGVLKMFSFGKLLHLAVKNHNKILIGTLAQLYDENIHYVENEYIEELIQLNHQDVNKNILIGYNFSFEKHYSIIYQYNKFIYDSLPIDVKQINAKYLVGLVSEDTSEEVLLHQDIKELVLSNKVGLLRKYLQIAQQAVKAVDDLFIGLVNKLSIGKEIKFTSNDIDKFNNTFNRYFKYKNFNHISYFQNDGILRPHQIEELNLIMELRKNHMWLEDRFNLESNKDKTRSKLYSLIEYTFINKFETNLISVSNEVLIELIPYLDTNSLHLVLNNYNRENQTLLKLLLVNGAKFYKNFQASEKKSIVFNLFPVELKSRYEVEAYNKRNDDKFDNFKTMQFKMLLGLNK